ncbi:hypothetical protein BDR07DRAFT_1409362 [Suillus spraguei]|nr:hypothetical protein BDR07DRAFT_1409362 [Suillus spraguei]
MPQRTQRQVQVQNLIISDGVLANGDSSFSDLDSNTSMSMSSDSSSPTTGSLSSTSESDTNEPSDDSSVYSDPSSSSTVSRLDSSTDSDTESESAGSNPDSGTEADDELDANILKPRRPDKFRESLRVSPYTFDQICTKLASDHVFTNNSQNEQIPLADQLAVALYHFGHGASMQTDCCRLGWAWQRNCPPHHLPQLSSAHLSINLRFGSC